MAESVVKDSNFQDQIQCANIPSCRIFAEGMVVYHSRLRWTGFAVINGLSEYLGGLASSQLLLKVFRIIEVFIAAIGVLANHFGDWRSGRTLRDYGYWRMLQVQDRVR